MRRAIVVFAVVVISALACCGDSTTTQTSAEPATTVAGPDAGLDSTPVPTRTAEATTTTVDEGIAIAELLLDAWCEGWNHDDADAAASLFIENGVYVAPINFQCCSAPFEGTDEIRQHVLGMSPLVEDCERTGAATPVGDGRYTGPSEFTTNGTSRWAVTSVVDLEGGLISRLEAGEAKAIPLLDADTMIPDPDPTGTVAEIALYNADANQAALVAWALARFDAARLPRPAIASVTFPPTVRCDVDHLVGAMAHDDRGLQIEVCVQADALQEDDPPPAEARHSILHEFAHAWNQGHLDDATKQAFLARQGLAVWSGADTWEENGQEIAAEIMTWALMDEMTYPMGISYPSCDALIDSYEILTATPATDRRTDCTDEGFDFFD